MFTKSVLIQVWLFSLAIIDASNNTTQNTFDLKLLIAESAAFSICNVKQRLTKECKNEHKPKIDDAMLKCEDQWETLQNCLEECYKDANNLFLQFDDPNEAMDAISAAQQKCIAQDNKEGCLYTKIKPFTQCIMDNNKDKRRLLETQKFRFDSNYNLNENPISKRRLGSSEDFEETWGEWRQRNIRGNTETVFYGAGAGVIGGAVGAVVGLALPYVFGIAFKCVQALHQPSIAVGTVSDSGPFFTQHGAWQPWVHTASHYGMYVGAAIGAVVGIVKGVYYAQDLKESTVRSAREEFEKEAEKFGGFRSWICLFRHPYCNIGRKGWFYFEGMANECCVGGYRTKDGMFKNYHYCNCYGNGDNSRCKLCKPKTLSPTMNPILKQIRQTPPKVLSDRKTA